MVAQFFEAPKERSRTDHPPSLAVASYGGWEPCEPLRGAGPNEKIPAVKYVYLLRSVTDPDKRYVGITSDFQSRLRQHNSSSSAHTKEYRPWKPVVVVRFENDQRAEAFEQYLKSGSGHAFASRHFW